MSYYYYYVSWLYCSLEYATKSAAEVLKKLMFGSLKINVWFCFPSHKNAQIMYMYINPKIQCIMLNSKTLKKILGSLTAFHSEGNIIHLALELLSSAQFDMGFPKALPIITLLQQCNFLKVWASILNNFSKPLGKQDQFFRA